MDPLCKPVREPLNRPVANYMRQHSFELGLPDKDVTCLQRLLTKAGTQDHICVESFRFFSFSFFWSDVASAFARGDTPERRFRPPSAKRQAGIFISSSFFGPWTFLDSSCLYHMLMYIYLFILRKILNNSKEE